MAKDCADCGLADCGLEPERVGGLATSDPLEARFRGQIRDLRGKRRRKHPSGASGTKFEAVPGPAP
eukprot:7911440-Alexandrium_andersonii.AAC.1